MVSLASLEGRFAQRARGAAHALLRQRESVGHCGFGRAADVRLDELRQRVEAGAWP
jgi:hypothetical protein